MRRVVRSAAVGRLVSAGLLVAMTGCASARAGVAGGPDGPEGCYQIEWNADMARLGMPWGFELLDQPLDPMGVDGVATAFRAVTRTTATRRTDTPFNVWRFVDGTRFRVGYAPVGGALSMALHVEGDALVGTVQSVGDALEPGQEPGPRPPEFVRAWRVVCPAPG